MEKYPFVKCLNPQKICNPYTKESMIVECGKCAACMLQKSSMRSLKCKLESMSHKYTFFITLTYSNDYVPKMIPLITEQNRLVQKNYYYFMDITDRLCYGELLAEGYLSLAELDMIRQKTNLGEAIPFLSKRDAQLFIKRLRKETLKYSDEKLRYYIVGEYGPVHFRPHYHLELWFSDEQIAKNLEKIISKVWTFGRIDVQKSVGNSASYVAGYLNSSCNLPDVYCQSKTKPFACHSFRLGEAILQSTKKEVYEMSAGAFVSRSLVINGVDTKFSLWRSFKTAYYPRCPKYATRNSNERYRSYTTYASASEIFGKISPYQQAVKIVDKIISDDYWIKLYPVCLYFKDEYNIHPFMGQTDYERSIRRVYMELRTSKLFIDFVCDGQPSIAGVKLIERFYSDCDYLNLVEQIKQEDEFLKYDAYDIDDLFYFYHNKPFEVENFKALQLFRQFEERTSNKARDSVKHKYLNDKNKIFTEF